MRDEQKFQVIGLWLLDLAEVTKGGREPPTPHKIAIYTEQLAGMFPSTAFTAGSLREVIFEQEYFPALDTVRARVRQWWHENKTSGAPMIAFEGAPRLDAAEASWVTHYYRRRGEIMATEGNRQFSSDAERAGSAIGLLESCIRKYAPNGWLTITGQREREQLKPTQQELDDVAEMVRSVVEKVKS